VNCKQGDVAMIVRVEHDHTLLGILCTCVQYIAEIPRTAGKRDWWLVRFLGPPKRGGSGNWVQQGYIRDAQLRPIAALSHEYEQGTRD
jgi:hypothetical protein